MSHVYKFEFNTIIKHFCYFRMKQKIIEKSSIYTQLKNIIIENILSLDSKSILSDVNSNHIMFNHFVDNDIKNFDILKILIHFLHFHYFFRLSWAKFILNSSKCEFFVVNIQLLKYQKNVKNIKSNENKLSIFRNFLNFTSKNEFERFLYIFFFLKIYIFEKIDRNTFLRIVIIEKTITIFLKKKKHSVKIEKKFLWTFRHEKIFQKIKKIILKIVCSRNNDIKQWYFFTNAFKIDAKNVLFQISNQSTRITYCKKLIDNLQIVMFLSYQFTFSQTRYQIIEKKTLIVIRCLFEIK